MRVVNSGNNFNIYDNSVELFSGLPPKVYGIDFDPMRGYSLYLRDDIEIKEKVYGVHEAKVKKVLTSFSAFERSLGVILSGDKGIGKSLFAKMLCCKAGECGYPVIVCDAYHPGIANFLDSMDQEMVILFDEFDKNFVDGKDNSGAQAALLSLFDGVSMNKKLFIVTCNDLFSLNAFLVNRPGRFHYHFRFEYPNDQEIEIYMKEHIPLEKYGEIEKIVQFAQKTYLNYDCLRAIAFELHHCGSFEEAIGDLNIIRTNNKPMAKMYIRFKDGTLIKHTGHVDMFSDEVEGFEFGYSSEAEDDYLLVKFTPSDAVFDASQGGFYIPSKLLDVKETEDLEDEGTFVIRYHKDFVLSHRAEDVEGVIIKSISTPAPIHYFKG